MPDPSGSPDEVPTGDKSAAGKPRCCNSVHISGSQATMTPRLTWAAIQAAACCRLAPAAASVADAAVDGLAGADLTAGGSTAARACRPASVCLSRTPDTTATAPPSATTVRTITTARDATRRRRELPGTCGRTGRAEMTCRCSHSRSVVAITVGHDGTGCGRLSPPTPSHPPDRIRKHDTALTALVHHITTSSHSRTGRFMP